MLIEQLSAIFAGYCSGLPGIQQLKKKKISKEPQTQVHFTSKLRFFIGLMVPWRTFNIRGTFFVFHKKCFIVGKNKDF